MTKHSEAWWDTVAARLRKEVDEGTAQAPEKVTVRELLALYGYVRRGSWINARIREDLEARALAIAPPDFESVWVDRTMRITLEDGGQDALADAGRGDPTVRVDILEAAHRPPTTVHPDSELVKATTLMRLHDYSQLPVQTTPRHVKGVVSWKSIGEAHAQGWEPAYVRECMDAEPEFVKLRTPLAEAAQKVYEHDFVLVRDGEDRIAGIVTVTDLARQFKQLAEPFVLIGEIELRLRNLLRGKFEPAEFVDAAGGDEEARGPDKLTFGGIERMLQGDNTWAALDLGVDHTVFLQRIASIRRIRNDVMHFAPEPLPASALEELGQVANFLRSLASLA